MLNKTVCKYCYEKTFPPDSEWAWTAYYEKNWEINNSIFCPNYGFRTGTKEPPPDECPYILEHVLYNDGKGKVDVH